MGTFIGIEIHVTFQSFVQIGYAVVLLKIDFLIFQRPPKSFNEHVVDRSPISIHTDLNLVLFEHRSEPIAGELNTLIGIEHFGQTAAKL